MQSSLNQNPTLNINQLNNAKQLHKQLQQLYMSKKKKSQNTATASSKGPENQEVLLKNLV